MDKVAVFIVSPCKLGIYRYSRTAAVDNRQFTEARQNENWLNLLKAFEKIE
ncbi:hypothetical protein ACJJIF_11395 [Microbulbifer sp. SSSA002]|uniref:hypothetical protein n=1 Tax=Microbulbifer sp. SSSA002 TaxID=3243376 RepID=UPI0040396DAF